MKTLMQWKVEEYHQLIQLGIFRDRRVELLEGQLIKMAPEGPTHAYLTGGIANYLNRLLSGMALVREAHPITLANSEPEPDIAIVKLPRGQYRDRHPGPDDIFWLIEIAQSTLDYDLNDKKKAYAKAGIQEYWVLEINLRQINQVHQFLKPIRGIYESEKIYRTGKIIPRAFANIEVDVNQLWQ